MVKPTRRKSLMSASTRSPPSSSHGVWELPNVDSMSASTRSLPSSSNSVWQPSNGDSPSDLDASSEDGVVSDSEDGVVREAEDGAGVIRRVAEWVTSQSAFNSSSPSEANHHPEPTRGFPCSEEVWGSVIGQEGSDYDSEVVPPSVVSEDIPNGVHRVRTVAEVSASSTALLL